MDIYPLVEALLAITPVAELLSLGRFAHMNNKPNPKPRMSDNHFGAILIPITCFVAGYGAYSGLLVVTVLGIMLPPIAFAFRRLFSS